MPDIVMVQVDHKTERPFFTLAKFGSCVVSGGIDESEAVFAPGSPSEVRVTYRAIRKRDWPRIPMGEDQSPPFGFVCHHGYLFSRSACVKGNGTEG